MSANGKAGFQAIDLGYISERVPVALEDAPDWFQALYQRAVEIDRDIYQMRRLLR